MRAGPEAGRRDRPGHDGGDRGRGEPLHRNRGDDRHPALHFIGFRGDEYTRAVGIFGVPDFIHIGWDLWARQAVAPGDVAVFARGTFDAEPSRYSFPDIREDDASG